ncbi:DNA-binding response regulator [Pandoraea terrae]|uniref:DNA-binding response regulator n=1 Tax=Pandoraea terrae TaxID=1537710 RepID=A0A5E4V3D9_9BURK|nr:response regulator transcription factor [Pandoraea terrae]VVE06748.1 DNA-binding response regulator [Pandoraea terrae]
MRILVVENDDRSANYLLRGLGESGHVADSVPDGETALALLCEGIYDIAIVDRRLPGIDGIELVRRLRAAASALPVLMLSGLGSSAHRTEGLRAGCDDYLAKPYAFSELLARIEALGRRTDRSRRDTLLRVADLVLDTRARTASRGGVPLNLQHREFLLLELLMRHAGQVVSRGMLLEAAWDYAFEPRGNIIDMHMHRLRRKVDKDFPIPLLHTVPGAGYTLRAPA